MIFLSVFLLVPIIVSNDQLQISKFSLMNPILTSNNVIKITKKHDLVSSSMESSSYKGIRMLNYGIPVTGECGEAVRYSIHSNGHAFIFGTGFMSNFSSITSPFYHYRNIITKMTIGDGVLSIGNFSFLNLSNLQSIHIPQTVILISDTAFLGCTNLSSIFYRGQFNPKCSLDFYNQSSIQIHVLNKSYQNNTCCGLPISKVNHETDIRPSTHHNSKQLLDYTSICGPNVRYTVYTSSYSLSITGTGRMYDYDQATLNSPFRNYYNYIRTATIGSGVTSIGNAAFVQLIQMTSISLPNTILEIMPYAFALCSKLQSISLPPEINYIGDYTFDQCSALPSIRIPEKVVYILTCAFTNCVGLRSVTFSNALQYVGQDSFFWVHSVRRSCIS